MKTYRIDDAHQSLVLASDGGLPFVVHWGARLPDHEDITSLAAALARDVTGGMMDANAPISVCPQPRDSYPGQPGLRASDAKGRRIAPDFRLNSVETSADALHFRATGDGLTYSCSFRLSDGMLTAQAWLSSQDPIQVAWLAAPALPCPDHSDGLTDFSGRWIGEFRPERHAWRPGVHEREARLGRSGHEHPPFALLTTAQTSNTAGEAWALAYGWSGGHRMIAEELPDGRRVVMFGHATGAHDGLGTRFETAPLTASYSATGTNGCATRFQAHIRNLTARSRQPRPVHYNCWEAIYFDHSQDVLQDIAKRAADLGAERFVLDDGWFGKRDDDTTSLGDWQIDRRKWPDGLAPFAKFVNGLGMGFGLWVEPEMVNKDSDLFRAHPDWLLGPQDQTPGRQQYVLNLALEDVRNHLFDRLDTLLSRAPIEYLKWDHNRLLPLCDADQTYGIYALLARLRAAHPEVEIESCASGGGRIDLGILQHTQRVWLSDSNDALERLRIQHDAALFLPASITGSHVGPRVCHTSGRTLSMTFRAWVAAQRHMGFEMDPRELTDDEASILRRVTRWWKDNRDWMMNADLLRLDSADPAVIAEQHNGTGANAGRFVVFAGTATAPRQILPRPLRLTGLDPNALYEIDLINRDEAHRLSRGQMPLKDGPLRLTGAALMRIGLALPWTFPERMWVLTGTRIKG